MKSQNQTMATDRHAFQELCQLLAMGAVVGVAILCFTVMTWTEILLFLPVMIILLYILRIKLEPSIDARKPKCIDVPDRRSPPVNAEYPIDNANVGAFRCRADIAPQPLSQTIHGIADVAGWFLLFLWLAWFTAEPLRALIVLLVILLPAILLGILLALTKPSPRRTREETPPL